MKIGSLFDGSGGFPLAASMCGIKPTWASEVEPFPIAVTRSRFPEMKHLGSVTEVKGDEVEPVDIITFGSPCQDLSVAGKRAGLKHTENGDEETTRSGLFMEAVRIIKEMRKATNGEFPRYAVWENVPGAFSSQKGEDFRVVLEELIRIAEPTAVMPEVPKAGWAYADVYCGDGWSLAYRVLDAQYWGVPQRRRRIYLVADFRGQRAGKILFESQGLRGHLAKSGAPWQATAGDAQGCTGADGREGAVPYTLKIRSGCEGGGKGALIQTDKSATLSTLNDQYLFQPVAFSFDSLASNSMKSSNPHSGCRQVEVAKTLDTTDPNPSKSQGGIAIVEQQPVYCLQGAGATSQKAQGMGYTTDTSYTLNATDIHGVAYLASGKKTVGTLMANAGTKLWPGNQEAFSGDYHIIEEQTESVVRYIVRRLIPTECARLQGFADRWGDIDQKDDFTDEEYRFWLNVRNTHAEINGKATKEYTRDQMLTWYNKLHTDSAEYKLWGNGIALPCALYVMEGIANEN